MTHMKLKPHLKQVRRFSQLACLLIFFFLFRQTDYSGSDTLDYAVNILFRLDPLVLAAVTLAQKTVIPLLWPSFIIIGLTLLFGRVFCSWICPLGTLLDICGRFVTPRKKYSRHLRGFKYVLLTIVLTASMFGVQLLGYVDPFSLLVRAMVFSIDPLMNYAVSGFFDTVYAIGPATLSNLTEPLYKVMKTLILPYRQSFFYLSGLSFFLLIFIFCLEFFGKRFWCRILCPLGGLLALVSRISIFKRVPVKPCTHCGMCVSECRMAAIEKNRRVMFDECNLCMDCLEFCPDNLTTFKFAFPKAGPPIDISRRQWMAAGLTGLALPVLSRTNAVSKLPDNDLIRPPGALEEPDFSAVCVRCGECMKVCINNALQPLFMEAGFEGMFTPRLVPRMGYCEFNCTLCSQVCPTGALEKLTLEKKHAFVLGKAYFDKNRCLVYAENKACIVCEEHCPTHDKAIKFREINTLDHLGKPLTIKQPYVVNALCVGCGICENICPVRGSAAIRVIAKGRSRRVDSGYG